MLNGGWCTQAARNLSMRIDLGRFRFLIRAHATVFVSSFDEMFTTEGIDILKSPPAAP